MASRHAWTSDELLVAFRLYCRTPFGRLHQHNPEIVELAGVLGRTPSAVAMKACNFASLDPAQQRRKIRALANVSRADRELWERFLHDSESIAAEAEAAYSRLCHRDELPEPPAMALPTGPTEVERSVRVRRVQRFFASAVLASYDYHCALTGLEVQSLLNASHIIPWVVSAERRADPRNGIALNVLCDRAFDRGLITLDESLRVVISPCLPRQNPSPFLLQCLLSLEGAPLRRPHRFEPDPEALAYHRQCVFQH